MHRITAVIDLADPSACLSGDPVSSVQLVHVPGGGMFVVVAYANKQAALVPTGRLDLESDDGVRALESFRRWLKQQNIPLEKTVLRTAQPGAYDQIVATGAFAVAGLCDLPNDPAVGARFQDWASSKSITPAKGTSRLSA
jgi:hypothetical protein